MHKMKKGSHDKPSQASEPQPEYAAKNAGKSIRFFSSFEEMNEADAKELSQFTPEQHLQHVTEMLKHLYAEELKKPFTNLKIYFK